MRKFRLKVGNHFYTSYKFYRTKRRAKREAKIFRQQGFFVRVIPEKVPVYGNV